MGILGLISPLQQLHFLRGLGRGNAATALATGVFFQWVCEYVMLFLTTTTAFLLPCLKLIVCVLYSEALWQRAIFSSQGLYHDVHTFSSIGPSCLHWYNVG